MSVVVKIEGVAIDANKIAEKSITIKRTYEKGRSLSLSLYYTAAETIPTEGMDIEVLDGTTTLFGGIIKTTNSVPITPDQSTSADLKIQITSDGYNYIPQRRTVNTSYPANTTAGSIVSDMITSFLSQEGVTVGTIDTGATYEVGYNGVYQSVKEVLDDMAEASGYTWNIDDSKSLNFEAQDTPVISTKTLTSDDGDHFNFRPKRSLSRFRNKQFVEGGVDGDGATVRAVVEDTVNIASRAAAENNSGVYGNVFRDSTIQSVTDAITVATDLLRINIKPAEASFSSYALVTEYDEGEVIEVTYGKYGIASGSDYLVTTKTLKRDAHRWVYTYVISARDVTDYSAKSKGDAVDFFRRLARGTVQTASNVVTTVISWFVQDNEPTGADEKAIWIDTNDFTSHDTLTLSTTTALSLDDKELIFASGTITITLPDISTASHKAGVKRIIKNTGTGVITLAPATGTIEGNTSVTIAAGEALTVATDGTNWKSVSSYIVPDVDTTTKTVTIDSSKVDADLTDYPVMVKLTSSNWDFNDIEADGSDIYFQDSTETTDLKFERVYYSSADEVAIFFVKIPSVSSSTDTTFKIKNGSTTDKEDITNTWNTDFLLVHHMDTALLDSTSNDYDGTNNGSTVVDGLNGEARQFDGSNDYVDTSGAVAVNSTNTHELLIKPDSPSGTGQIISLRTGTAYDRDGIQVRTDGKIRYFTFNTSDSYINIQSSNAVTFGSWNYIAVKRNGTSVEIFVNGTKTTGTFTDPRTYTSTVYKFGIGTDGDDLTLTEPYDGTINEIRTSDALLSEAWLTANDHNLRQNNLVSIAA